MQVFTDAHGHRVRLTDERFTHLLDHPEMAGLEATIPETLAEPNQVVQSNNDRQGIPKVRREA